MILIFKRAQSGLKENALSVDDAAQTNAAGSKLPATAVCTDGIATPLTTSSANDRPSWYG